MSGCAIGKATGIHTVCCIVKSRAEIERLQAALSEALGTLRMLREHCIMNDMATPRVMEKLEEVLATLSKTMEKP
jgi:hypothetical protein